jgi:hypothetical protein
VGLTGNERADHLARKGVAKLEVDITQKSSIQDVYSKIEKDIYAEWQILYNNSSTARNYKLLEPIVSKDIKFVNNNRRKEVIIARLRLGKCLLNSYLHKMARHDTGLCDACKVPETVEHFLLECTASDIFHNSNVKTLNAAFSRQNIEKMYERILKLKRKL